MSNVEAMEVVVLAVLVLSAATWVTTHVVLCARLIRAGAPWKGLVALLTPPLAPYWGGEARFRKLSALWVLSAAAYGAALIAALI